MEYPWDIRGGIHTRWMVCSSRWRKRRCWGNGVRGNSAWILQVLELLPTRNGVSPQRCFFNAMSIQGTTHDHDRRPAGPCGLGRHRGYDPTSGLASVRGRAPRRRTASRATRPLSLRLRLSTRGDTCRHVEGSYLALGGALTHGLGHGWRRRRTLPRETGGFRAAFGSKPQPVGQRSRTVAGPSIRSGDVVERRRGRLRRCSGRLWPARSPRKTRSPALPDVVGAPQV